jgi:hypothetical protein
MHTKLSLTLTDGQGARPLPKRTRNPTSWRFSIAVVDESSYRQHLLRMDRAS